MYACVCVFICACVCVVCALVCVRSPTRLTCVVCYCVCVCVRMLVSAYVHVLKGDLPFHIFQISTDNWSSQNRMPDRWSWDQQHHMHKADGSKAVLRQRECSFKRPHDKKARRQCVTLDEACGLPLLQPHTATTSRAPGSQEVTLIKRCTGDHAAMPPLPRPCCELRDGWINAGSCSPLTSQWPSVTSEWFKAQRRKRTFQSLLSDHYGS